MSCLLVTAGTAKGRTFQVSPERPCAIGRAVTCEVCIPDPRISRRHCTIYAGQAGYLVCDNDSVNGLFLNGSKVKEAPLKEGDRIRLGTTELEFHLTERFEDAETKRLPGDAMGAPVPSAAPARRRPSGKLDTEAILFCARCSGSIAAGELASGRALRTVEGLVCVECLARDRGAADAAAAARAVGEAPTDAEEVSQLAEELARDTAAYGAVPDAASSGPPAPAEVIELDSEGLPKVPEEEHAPPANLGAKPGTR